MKEYLKSEYEDRYCELTRYSGGTYLAKFWDELRSLPDDGVVVGTYHIYYDAGYNELTGEIYDECDIDLFKIQKVD